jgi:curli biogenesis system outer membrane secretion channel CsgG
MPSETSRDEMCTFDAVQTDVRMVRRIASVLFLLLPLVGARLAGADPDLTVARLSVQPSAPIPGSTVTITATVENVGSSDATSAFFIQYDIDGRRVDAVPVPLGLRAGEKTDVSANWVAEEGSHVVSAEVDRPFDRIAEENESNNDATLTLFVPLSAVINEQYGWLRVAIARFQDQSGSGFVHVGGGVSDILGDRLAWSGIDVVRREELEAAMQQQGLDPASIRDLTTAAESLGANLLISGTVNAVNVQQASVDAWIFRFSSASVDVSISAQVVATHAAQPLTTLFAEGHEEGGSEFSVNCESILGPRPSLDVCFGGLTTDRTWYYVGETIPAGYLNPASPSWYSVEIHSSTGTFLRWLGWQYIVTGGCGRWFWDQRDSLGAQMPHGIYSAKLWDGTSYVETTSFQIRPGAGLVFPPIDEITVGSAPFEETIAGEAVEKAVDQLAVSFMHELERISPLVAETQARSPAADPTFSHAEREGKIAAILPDGRVAVNIGSSSGVVRGDFFQVLGVENLVVDSESHEILGYDIVAVKGEIVVVEVRDRVSYAVKTEEFESSVGDVVRYVLP